MKTAEERRIEFYGTNDARAYDHDELYLMKQYAIDYHETAIKKLHKPEVSGSLPIEVSKILDNHLPAEGVGTEREKLRMMLHNEICMLVANLRITSAGWRC